MAMEHLGTRGKTVVDLIQSMKTVSFFCSMSRFEMILITPAKKTQTKGQVFHQLSSAGSTISQTGWGHQTYLLTRLLPQTA